MRVLTLMFESVNLSFLTLHKFLGHRDKTKNASFVIFFAILTIINFFPSNLVFHDTCMYAVLLSNALFSLKYFLFSIVRHKRIVILLIHLNLLKNKSENKAPFTLAIFP